jgi:hypothetical protein
MKATNALFSLSTCLLSLLVFAASPVLAADLQAVFESLKSKAVDYETSGQICEEVARLEFAKKYDPSLYLITGGVEYKIQKQVVGELDLIIVDRQSQEVVLIGEVKCWKSPKDAIAKAQEQRARFQSTLKKYPGQIVFDSDEGLVFQAGQFQHPQFISIAQAGTSVQGFDYELSYTLQELMQVRNLMLRCQSQGRCPKPVFQRPKDF